MADVDRFTRSYLFVDVHKPPTSEAVAELLDSAAAALRASGEVDVHHIAYDATDGTHSPAIALIIYYDRIERRRRHRHPGELSPVPRPSD